MNFCVGVNAFKEGSPSEETIDVYGDTGLKTVFFTLPVFDTRVAAF